MLHTKVHGNRSTGSKEEDFKAFYHIWARKPSGHVTNIILTYTSTSCRKIGQSQTRVIICTNYDGLESQMLHTKFRGNRSNGSGEEDF